MKINKNTTFLVLIIPIFLVFTSCDKSQNSYSIDCGKVVFWKEAGSQVGKITVILNTGASGIILTDLSEIPDCDIATGSPVFVLKAGVYTYHAEEEDINLDGVPDHEWEGIIVIEQNSCKKIRLYI